MADYMTKRHKHYRDKTTAERLVERLNRRDRLRERRDRDNVAVYGIADNLSERNPRAAAAVAMIDVMYYYNAFQSPARYCPAWVQRLQGLTGSRLESAIDNILCNGLQTK